MEVGSRGLILLPRRFGACPSWELCEGIFELSFLPQSNNWSNVNGTSCLSFAVNEKLQIDCIRESYVCCIAGKMLLVFVRDQHGD